MRYSFSALVLATFTICQVGANPVRHSHQRFHEKKDLAAQELSMPSEAELELLKREPGWEDVDFTKLDWSKISITFSAGQTWGQPTPAPVAVAATAAPVVAAVATAAPAVVAPAVVAPVLAPAAVASPAVAAAVDTTSTAKSSVSLDLSLGGLISTTLSTVGLTKLLAIGVVSEGINALTSAGGMWLGSDGDYTNEFTNASGEDIILVVWGSWASWVNVHTPMITVTIPAGGKTTVSFADGSVGGFAPIYSDTQMSAFGQIYETWGEFTFTSEGVVDVSREVNMNGHSMKIVGPTCTTDMDTCVFKCNSGVTCTTGYSLVNCANGSQTGATFGAFDGADTGGCAWHDSKVALKTTFM